MNLEEYFLIMKNQELLIIIIKLNLKIWHLYHLK